MKNAIAAWVWSLSVLGRSLGAVLALAVLLALWGLAAYEWLGLPESSALVLVVALIWAILQVGLAVVLILGGVSRATQAVGDGRFRLRGLQTKDAQFSPGALLLGLALSFLAFFLSKAFSFVNSHSVDVASFVTFHTQKPVSHVLLERIYFVIEAWVWIALGGFFLSFLIKLAQGGGRAALQHPGKLLAGCTFQTPFLTSLLSVGVFGGAAYGLTVWHPPVPPGFWDYTQLVVRFSLVPLLLAAGWLFWLLSLARLHVPPATSSPHPETRPAIRS